MRGNLDRASTRRDTQVCGNVPRGTEQIGSSPLRPAALRHTRDRAPSEGERQTWEGAIGKLSTDGDERGASNGGRATRRFVRPRRGTPMSQVHRDRPQGGRDTIRTHALCGFANRWDWLPSFDVPVNNRSDLGRLEQSARTLRARVPRGARRTDCNTDGQRREQGRRPTERNAYSGVRHPPRMPRWLSTCHALRWFRSVEGAGGWSRECPAAFGLASER